MLAEIRADFDRLKHQIKMAGELPPEVPDDISSMTYQLLCVAIVGRLEQNLKTIFIYYGNNNSNRAMGKAITRLCQSFQNPKPEKIIDLVGLFDKEFATLLHRNWLDSSPSDMDVIRNMVGERIAVAHQKTKNFSITRTKVEQYYDTYKRTVTQIHDHFLTD